MQQTIGSPINTALAPEYEADQIVNFPSAWSKTLTEIPGTGVVGATYDVEIANGYDYLFQEGLLKEGDTVGHIYFEGEYGANGLAGTQGRGRGEGPQDHRGADQVHRPGHERPDHPVQGGRASTLIALTVAPGAAGVGGRGGRGAGPGRADPRQQPGLRARPARRARRPSWLKSHLYVASPVSSFDEHPDLLKAYQAAYPDVTPSLGVLVGTGMASS